MSIILKHRDADSRPLVIDPPNCGCLDCQTGESTPFDRIGAAHIRQLLAGAAEDRSDIDYSVEAENHEYRNADRYPCMCVKLTLNYTEPQFWSTPAHPAEVHCYVMSIHEVLLDPEAGPEQLLPYTFTDDPEER